jgi:drug/metabolite transporter (DMT)-like permease
MTGVQEHSKGILFVAVAALLWSTGGIGIKGIADSALKVAFYRSLFAAITLLLLFGPRVWARRRWRSTPVFLFAIFSYGACLTTFVTATKWTTAANAIFLQYAGVIWVLLLSPLVLKEPLRRRDVAAIVVAIGGMALFFVGRFEARGMAGNAMALLSSVFFAGLILALRRERDAGQSAITWGNLFTAAALLPFVAGDLALSGRSAGVLVGSHSPTSSSFAACSTSRQRKHRSPGCWNQSRIRSGYCFSLARFLQCSRSLAVQSSSERSDGIRCWAERAPTSLHPTSESRNPFVVSNRFDVRCRAIMLLRSSSPGRSTP